MQYVDWKTVYINKDEITEIKAIEHDTKTRFINFKFVGDNTAIDLTGCKVRVYGKNSRYIEIFNDLTILDAKRGIAQLELTDKMLRPGVTEYQLKIMPSGGGQLSSNTMKFVIDKDFMSDTAIESSNEYKAFENGLKILDQYDLRWQDGNIKTKDTILFNNSTIKASDTILYNNNKVYDTAHKPTPQELGVIANTGINIINGELKVGEKNNKYIDIGAGQNDVYIFNSKTNKCIQIKDDGTLCYSNRKIQLEPQKEPLWQGATYLSKGMNFKVSKPISECQNGWILVFSDYDPGGNPNGNNWNFCTHVVHKNSLVVNGGNVLFSIPSNESGGWTIKAAYILDNEIQGQSMENIDGWNDVVLRQILEY